jgi:hypothetical protein
MRFSGYKIFSFSYSPTKRLYFSITAWGLSVVILAWTGMGTYESMFLSPTKEAHWWVPIVNYHKKSSKSCPQTEECGYSQPLQPNSIR